MSAVLLSLLSCLFSSFCFHEIELIPLHFIFCCCCNRRLDDNHVKTIPDCVSGMEAVKILTLSKNKISALPKMDTMKALKELVLSDNSFSTFPEVVCLIPKLETLDLAKNSISVIPTSCTDNKIVNLFVSCFTPFQHFFFSCSPCFYSKLDQNSFEKFPVELGTWSELKTLNLAHNDIQEVNLSEDQTFAAMQDLFVSQTFFLSVYWSYHVCCLNSDVSYNRLVCEAVEEIFAGSRIVTCGDFSQNNGGSSSSSSSSSAPSSSAQSSSAQSSSAQSSSTPSSSAPSSSAPSSSAPSSSAPSSSAPSSSKSTSSSTSGSSGKSSSASSSGKKESGLKWWELLLIIGAPLVGVALIIVLIVACVCKQRRTQYEPINGSG